MDAFSQPLYPMTELGSVGCMTSTLSGVLAKLKVHRLRIKIT